MSLPKVSEAYPPSLLRAVQVAFDLGELRIPCDNPQALRLQFNGLRGALRRENAALKIDTLGFYVEKIPPALVLRIKETAPLVAAVDAAIDSTLLGEIPESVDDAFFTRVEEAFFSKGDKS